jgi:cyanophycinase
MPISRLTAVLIVTLLIGAPRADQFPTPTIAEVNPAGICGALVIVGGGKIPDAVLERFLDLAGSDEARLVVIPTASGRADENDLESFGETWRNRGFPVIDVLHTRDRTVADSEDFVAPLKSATAVWFVGGQQSRLSKAYVGTRVENELYTLLGRGGVIGGTSAGAAIQSRLMIASGNPEANLLQGLDLVPGAVIDQHFKVRNRQPRLTAVLAAQPGYFGLGIDAGTALVIRGRRIRILGDSSVTVCLSEAAHRPARQFELTAGRSADLVALRRAAIARAAPAFPPASPLVPRVDSGALMIVGGGKIPDEMRQRFVDLAGGPETRILIVPTASESPSVEDRSDVRDFKRAGAKTVAVYHTSDRAEAEREEIIAPLRSARRRSAMADSGRLRRD